MGAYVPIPLVFMLQPDRIKSEGCNIPDRRTTVCYYLESEMIGAIMVGFQGEKGRHSSIGRSPNFSSVRCFYLSHSSRFFLL